MAHSMASESPVQRSGGIKRTLLRGVVVASACAMLSAGIAGSANAAPGDTSDDTTVARVVVTSAILLQDLTPSFTLTGLPGATVTGAEAVSFTVITNNFTGYAVTVQSQSATLDPVKPGNTDSIPIGNLRVRETAAVPGAWTSLSSTSPVTVHSQGTRSAPLGDTFANDYQVSIPFVAEDTYVATLDYIATTL